MAGLFFNLCMPGTTGGDVMKAYYAARSTDQRGDAVVSVMVDRVCGLLGLILLVGVVGLFSLHDPLISKLVIAMWAGFAALIVFGLLYTSPRLREKLKFKERLSWLPGVGLLKKVDGWVAAYRNHLGTLASAIALSMPMHLGLAGAMVLAGYALGIDQPLLYLLGTVPVVFLLWSLPISGPLGLGPLDYVAVQLIIGTSDSTTAQQAVVMFVAYRLYAVVMGLCGSAALIGSGAPSSKPPEDNTAEQGNRPATN